MPADAFAGFPARLRAVLAALETAPQAVIGADFGALIRRRRDARATVTVREAGTELRLDACGPDPDSARRALADLVTLVTGEPDAS